MKNADFKIRLVATLLDSFIMLFILAVFYSNIVTQPDLQHALTNAILALIILNPIFLLYSILMTYYFSGTLGKLLTGLEVVREDKKKLSFKRILFRQTVGYSFSGIFFGLGYLAIIKDPDKLAWHDKTVGSFVVQKGNLLLQGVFLSVLLLGASIYIFIQATQSFMRGPLYQEIQTLKSSKSPEPSDYNPSYTDPVKYPSRNGSITN